MNKKVKKKIMTLALVCDADWLYQLCLPKAASEDVIDTSKTASLTIHKYDIPSCNAGWCQRQMTRSLQENRIVK